MTRRIVTRSSTRRVDPAEVAKALGAEVVAVAPPHPQSPVGRMAVQQEYYRRVTGKKGASTRELIDVDVASHPGSPVRVLVES
jgi:hypothetical protein